jgi:flagellar hook-basal body complex protein FliE
MTVNGISGFGASDPISIAGSNGAAPRTASAGVPFSQIVSQLLQEADQHQAQVSQGVHQLMTGESDNIQDLAINMAKADVSFRLLMEVRDSLISAYQEVMKMQV